MTDGERGEQDEQGVLSAQVFFDIWIPVNPGMKKMVPISRGSTMINCRGPGVRRVQGCDGKD